MIKTPKDMASGVKHIMAKGNALYILRYQGVKNVLCQFEGTSSVVRSSSYAIRIGIVKDRNRPSVVGVGFIGYGKYKCKVNKKKTIQYIRWQQMITRCYCEKYQEKNPTYKGCSVVKEWHNFQNFAKWFDDNYIDGCDLDKDILIDGNRVYSANGCCFVSSYDNKEKANSITYELINPDGDLVSVYNLSKFCKEKELITSSMRCLFDGRMKSHRGWSRA